MTDSEPLLGCKNGGCGTRVKWAMPGAWLVQTSRLGPTLLGEGAVWPSAAAKACWSSTWGDQHRARRQHEATSLNPKTLKTILQSANKNNQPYDGV